MERLKKHLAGLKQIDTQRRWWLVLSAAVVFTIGYITFEWHFVHTTDYSWLIIGATLVTAAIWWYWTMRVIRHFIDFRKEETEILIDIIKEVREIKDEVKKTFK